MRDVTSTILTDLKGNRSFSLHSCLGGNRASEWWEQSARSRPWTRVGLDADRAREVAGAAIRGDLTEIWLGLARIVVMTTRSGSDSRGQYDRTRGGSCQFLVGRSALQTPRLCRFLTLFRSVAPGSDGRSSPAKRQNSGEMRSWHRHPVGQGGSASARAPRRPNRRETHDAPACRKSQAGASMRAIECVCVDGATTRLFPPCPEGCGLLEVR